jgi:hypothetical protein
MIRLELGSLGIISGEQKRALECFVDVRIFDQRKSFDEFTINTTNIQAAIGLKELMILAEVFIVRVLEDSVLLSDL